MSMPVDDPLDPNTVGRGGVPRDRWDRALLIPPDGGARVPYTSMSTLAKQLGSDYAIQRWRERNIAKGVGMSRELSAMAGASRYDTRIGEEDTGRNREEGYILDDVCERGLFLAGAHQKRDWGSAFHRYAEQEDPLGQPPVEMEADLEAFHRTLKLLGIKILATEVFVVNELLGAAGSFDYLFSVPWREKLVIGDSKTGVLKLDQDEIQLFGYAGSEIYDRDTDERTTFAEAYGMEVDQELAYTVHTAAESGETVLWPVDIVSGRESALLASAVHKRNSAVRKQYGKRVWKPLDVAELAEQRALEAIDRAAEAELSFEGLRTRLKEIHKEFKSIWTERLTTYGGAVLRRAREAAA